MIPLLSSKINVMLYTPSGMISRLAFLILFKEFCKAKIQSQNFFL